MGVTAFEGTLCQHLNCADNQDEPTWKIKTLLTKPSLPSLSMLYHNSSISSSVLFSPTPSLHSPYQFGSRGSTDSALPVLYRMTLLVHWRIDKHTTTLALKHRTWHMALHQGLRWTFCGALKYWTGGSDPWPRALFLISRSQWSWQRKRHRSVWHLLVLELVCFVYGFYAGLINPVYI